MNHDYSLFYQHNVPIKIKWNITAPLIWDHCISSRVTFSSSQKFSITPKRSHTISIWLRNQSNFLTLQMKPGQTYFVFSKNYPDNYSAGISCRWQVKSPPGSVCRFNCAEMDIPVVKHRHRSTSVLLSRSKPK